MKPVSPHSKANDPLAIMLQIFLVCSSDYIPVIGIYFGFRSFFFHPSRFRKSTS